MAVHGFLFGGRYPGGGLLGQMHFQLFKGWPDCFHLGCTILCSLCSHQPRWRVPFGPTRHVGGVRPFLYLWEGWRFHACDYSHSSGCEVVSVGLSLLTSDIGRRLCLWASHFSYWLKHVFMSFPFYVPVFLEIIINCGKFQKSRGVQCTPHPFAPEVPSYITQYMIKTVNWHQHNPPTWFRLHWTRVCMWFLAVFSHV